MSRLVRGRCVAQDSLRHAAEESPGVPWIKKGWIVLHRAAADLGFGKVPPFYQDRLFGLACLSGIGFWAWLWRANGAYPRGFDTANLFALLSFVFWQPFIEELVFRGYLQGVLCKSPIGEPKWMGVTLANLLTTVVFASAHLLTHPPSWVGGIFLVSLLLGYFRDRYASVYPCIVLHCYYNAGYFLTAGAL